LRIYALIFVVLVACGDRPEPGAGEATSAQSAVPPDSRSAWPCGGGLGAAPAKCDALAREYIAAMTDAQQCDAAASCAPRRPVGGYDTSGNAFLCNCTSAVNAGRTEAVDRVLAEFEAQGCV